jgi:glucose-1-phosphate thymidylyltransferase
MRRILRVKYIAFQRNYGCMFPWAWGWVARTPAVRPCHLLQPSTRGEYEISEAIDLLIQSGRTIDAVELDGWRIDIGYPDDRDEAETRLQTAGQPVPEQ